MTQKPKHFLEHLKKPKYLWILSLLIIAVILLFYQNFQNSQKALQSSNEPALSQPGSVSHIDPIASTAPPSVGKQPETSSGLSLKGKVKSKTEVNLSFKAGGTVSQVRVNVGDKIKKGAVLAMLERQDAALKVDQAQASLDLAQAQYDKTVNGTAASDITISQATVASAQTTLNNAKNNYDAVVQQQQVIIANDLETLLNSSLTGIPVSNNIYTGTLTVSGTYTATTTGSYNISIGMNGIGSAYNFNGLEAGSGQIVLNVPLPIGKNGLYIAFSKSASINPNDTWTVSIPNTQGATYLKNLAAYQNDLQAQAKAIATAQAIIDSAKASLGQANAQLAQKLAGSRSEDIAAAKAKLNLAVDALQAAKNNLSATQLIAPISGLVSSVDTRNGEQAVANKEAVILIDDKTLYAETEISEKLLNQVNIGQATDLVFDALGSNKHYKGKVVFISPVAASGKNTTTYKISSTIPAISLVKPGMSVSIKMVQKQKKTKVPGDF